MKSRTDWILVFALGFALGAILSSIARGNEVQAAMVDRERFDQSEWPYLYYFTLSVLPVTWDVAPHRVRIDHVSGLMPMVVRSRRDHPVGFRVKGLVDRVLAGIALLLALPVMAAIALAIRLDSPGSALFRQERVGRDGHVFTILKFRTMATDAEAVKAALQSQNKHGAGVLFKMEKDPRITRVGGVLRKLSLDELPQLINVVTGQMSRPEAVEVADDAQLLRQLGDTLLNVVG